MGLFDLYFQNKTQPKTNYTGYGQDPYAWLSQYYSSPSTINQTTYNSGAASQPTASTNSGSSSLGGGGGTSLFSLLGTARNAYNLYNRLFGSGTQTGYGSGAVPTATVPTGSGITGTGTGVGSSASELAAGPGGYTGGAAASSAGSAGAAAGDLAAGELAGGITTGAGGATVGEGAASLGLGSIGMLAAPIIMMGLAYGAGSGRNDPVERRNATLQAAQSFSDPNATPSDLGSLYRSMINMSRQGIFGADANSGFTRQQINDMLTNNNPGVTTGMLQQLSNPGGYDAIKQAYNQFLGRDPSESEYQMRLSTLPGYGTDAKWVTGLKQQLADIASSPEAQAYLTTNNKPLITQAQIDNIFKMAWANSVINGTPQTSF